MTKKMYEVGHGKPPLHSRFPKGVSGNRKGRPKKSRNHITVFEEVLGEIVEVRQGNGSYERMTRWEAMVRSASNNAIKGNMAAFRTCGAMVQQLLKATPSPLPDTPSGVLVVPGMMEVDDWEKLANEQQAPYRGSVGDPP